MAIWLRTDEQVEAVASLETAARAGRGVGGDLYEWRWVVLGLHSALQGFMVMALRGSDGLAPLRNDVAKVWMKAYREHQPLPEEKLDSFLALYSKSKGRRMRRHVDSAPFESHGSQDGSVMKLNALRNDFIHFLPRSWSLEVSGLPAICLDCLDIIEFLGWKCGNVDWSASFTEQRAVAAVGDLRTALHTAVKTYGGTAA